MKKYIRQLSKEQLEIINYNIFNDNKRAKCLSVLSYALKNLDESGAIRMSLDRLHQRYSAWKGRGIKIGRTHFINLVNELVELGLLTIKKVGRLNKYFFNDVVDEKMDEKVDENKSAQTIENTKSEQDVEFYKEEIRNKNLNTNTNIDEIIEVYSKSFKTISGNPTASKTELRQIAKNLFSLRNINESVVQSMVLSKINNSQQKINITGAVAYINKIITEKLVQTTTEYLPISSFGGYDLNYLEYNL